MLWTVVGILLVIVLIPLAWRAVAGAFSALFGGDGGLELAAALIFAGIVFACQNTP